MKIRNCRRKLCKIKIIAKYGVLQVSQKINAASEERYFRWSVKTGKGSTQLATRKTTRFDVIRIARGWIKFWFWVWFSCYLWDQVGSDSEEHCFSTEGIYDEEAVSDFLDSSTQIWNSNMIRMITAAYICQNAMCDIALFHYITLHCFILCLRWKQLGWLQKLILSLGLALEHSPSPARWRQQQLKSNLMIMKPLERDTTDTSLCLWMPRPLWQQAVVLWSMWGQNLLRRRNCNLESRSWIKSGSRELNSKCAKRKIGLLVAPPLQLCHFSGAEGFLDLTFKDKFFDTERAKTLTIFKPFRNTDKLWKERLYLL